MEHISRGRVNFLIAGQLFLSSFITVPRGRVNFLIAGQLRPPGDSVELRTPGVGALVASRAPGDKKGARFDLVFGISPPPYTAASIVFIRFFIY